MNNVLCIFPKDCTTEFLNPVYEEIISIYTAKSLLGDPTEDDEYLEKLSYEASRTDSIIFLGHGSSKSLYGLNFNEIICKENVCAFNTPDSFVAPISSRQRTNHRQKVQSR